MASPWGFFVCLAGRVCLEVLCFLFWVSLVVGRLGGLLAWRSLRLFLVGGKGFTGKEEGED